MRSSPYFNPRLREWLNERDFVSGDWPDNVPESVQREADRVIGQGRMLNDLGWPPRRSVAKSTKGR